ncbi:MAG: hypothetical protein QM811_09515, partial [Pirellulales bacterium]
AEQAAATKAVTVATPPTSVDLTAKQTEYAALSAETRSLASLNQQHERDSLEMERQADMLRREQEIKALERDRLTSFLAAGELRMKELRDKVGGESQIDFDLKRKLAETQSVTTQLRAAAETVSAVATPVVEIGAPSTPLSKVVDGEEVHFQLRGGRIAFVPMDELVETARRDVKPELDRMNTLSQLQESTEREFRAGPRKGFEMRYALMIKADRAGNRVAVNMSRFEIWPTQEILGETLPEALAPTSQFRADVRQFNSVKTTVTLWTYPDSFPLYRGVQDELRKLGYPIAGRPMPPGMPIGGSPNGKKSLAQ